MTDAVHQPTEPARLPPSVTIGATSVSVFVFAGAGVSVHVQLPRIGALRAASIHEVMAAAQGMARNALEKAAAVLSK